MPKLTHEKKIKEFFHRILQKKARWLLKEGSVGAQLYFKRKTCSEKMYV